MSSPRIELHAVAGSYWIHRLDPLADVPPAALASTGIVSITRTDQELSILTTAEQLDGAGDGDGPWSAWYIRGPIPFGLTGVVASVVGPLAAIPCPVFVVSTFDGDLICVPSERRPDAETALTQAGHHLRR